MEQILAAMRSQSEYNDIVNALQHKETAVMTGLPQLPKAAFIAAAFNDTPGSMLVLTAEESDAMTLSEDLRPFCGEQVCHFPVLELLPFEVYAHNIELVSARVSALSRLAQGEKLLVIACAGAVSRRLAPPDIFLSHHLMIRRGDTFELTELAGRLADMGYERTALTEIPGSFSMRGSIVDIFPVTSQRPYRIEFFDDEVDSIRFFDPADQISQEDASELIACPARELPVDSFARNRAEAALDSELQEILARLHGQSKKTAMDTFYPLKTYLSQGIWDNALEALTCYFYEEKCSIADYLPEGNIVLCEPQQIRQTMEEQESERNSRYFDLLDQGKLLPSFYNNFLLYSDLLASLDGRHLLLLSQLADGLGGIEPVLERNILSRDLPNYTHDPDGFIKDMRDFASSGYQILISASSQLRLQRAQDILKENSVSGVRLLRAGWSRGFESPSLKMALITEKELFSKEGRVKHRRTFKGGERIKNFMDLRAGDYVVHIYQGIGQYMGVERLTVDDVSRDYLLIRYSGEDKLYLPVDQLDLIQKYVGNEGNAPRLNRLGGSEWKRTKDKVRAAVREMAQELLKLYAAREQVKGFSFSPDTPWQSEFEDAFPYAETDDQLQSISEIKKDMESRHVMDRLLCGDVGYGKTEVALRAAFKAIMDSKQVAMLVPTTVLAQQHLHTIENRFSGFPVKYACLSRFCTPAQKKEILRQLETGELDLVVGTHALLGKNIKFKDLGLLIVDEEQRFGVAHKEKIKSLKTQVDVLTLSATPIPRTLHMALVGMRDMSLISTPPQDRHPVQTYVVEYHERMIRDAIARELGRGGQVFFLHNRVFDIYNVAEELQRILPGARVAVAHGQMKERELENVMMDFVDHKADILVCTTIIENGLDIPNANTLIVDDSDTLGLSQLYQLRGRVGRSKRQGFAYFTFRKDRAINDIARKRLIAIRDFTQLGAGFKIAMRDMELRGAGNILGPEQHGHIMAVGFDLYCKLLQDEIMKASGKEAPLQEVSTQMELGINAYIPDNFLSDAVLKVEIYKRMAAAESADEVDCLANEMRDRYGQLPDCVLNLCLLGKIKVLGKKLAISAIIQQPGCFEVKFAPEHPITGQALVTLCQSWSKRIGFSDKKCFMIRMSTEGLDNSVLKAETLLKMLDQLYGMVRDNVKKNS